MSFDEGPATDPKGLIKCYQNPRQKARGGRRATSEASRPGDHPWLFVVGSCVACPYRVYFWLNIDKNCLFWIILFVII